MRSNSPLALFFLLPLTSLAQPAGIVRDDLSRGVTLPPSSAATLGQPTALSLNPAGLAFVGELELDYLHERNLTRLETGDALFLGSTFFDVLGAGVSVEWLRSGAASRRKAAFGLSVGGQALSFGGSFAAFSSPELPELAVQKSWTLGVAGRPSKYLAYGLAVQNLDEPTQGALTLPRTWDLALATAPLGDKYQVAVDYVFQDSRGLGSGRFGYTVLAQVLPGLTFSGGLSHGLAPGSELVLQLGATVDTSHFGAGYAVGGTSRGLDHLVAVRLSQEAYPSVLSGGGVVAALDFGKLDTPPTSALLGLLGSSSKDPYLSLTQFLDAAIRDPSLRGVVLKVNPAGLGLGRAEELRQAVLKLRAAGKVVVAVILSAEDSDYLVASAADKIYAVPKAAVQVDGFQATPLFLGGTMEKLGVSWQVARVGDFKNAPDQLTRSSLSPEQRTALEATLDTDVKTFAAAVTKARGLKNEQLSSAIDEGLKTARRAKELGLIDDVLTSDELDKKLAELVPGASFDPDYAPLAGRDDAWGFKPRVAIIPVLGNIGGGRSGSSGLSRTAGAETIIRALQRAQADPGVSAIVVRVDSGGGDGLASDLIYRAVVEAKKHKPVVASMGDVAASGGYYVAMGADEIWAEPTTITGSIGVFLMRPAVEGLADKLGARQETIRRGKLSGLLDWYSPWTDDERAAAQKWVDAFYDDFITLVGASRHLPKEEVDKVARGRVWSGEDAKARGLVNELGGLLDAIGSARHKAGIADNVDVELEVMSEPPGLVGSLLGESRIAARLFPEVRAEPPVPEGLMRLARELGVDQALALRPGVWAAMEYSLAVH